MAQSPAVTEAIARSGRPTDDRGLLPLKVALAILKQHDLYRGAPVHEGRTDAEKKDVEQSHALHAALLSLDSPEAALAQLTRLKWRLPLHDAATLVDRYGDAVLPWLAGVVENGELLSKAWRLEEALALLGSEEAFTLLLKLRIIAFDYEPRKIPLGKLDAIPELDDKARVDIRVEKAIELFISKHPLVAAKIVAQRLAAAPKARRPRELAKLLPDTPKVRAALGGAKPVEPATTKAILAVLDEAAKDGAPQAWPKFATGIEDDPATLEYHALRLIGVRSRSSEDWGIALERISGSFSPWEPARVDRFLYGSKIRKPGLAGERPLELILDEKPDHENGKTLGTDLEGVVLNGPAGKLRLSNAFAEKHDLKAGFGTEFEGDAGFNLRLRAYLAAHPRAFWEKAKVAAAALGISDPLIVADTDSFAHVVGASYKRLPKGASHAGNPGKSQTYKSLAEAIVKRDEDLFDGGEPNVDWRLHATNKTA
jgi:hypothetical protein